MVAHGKQAPEDAAAETTHFGAETVAAADKAGRVAEVFDSVADRYDLMNDVMSGGLHRAWKASLIDSVRPRPGMRVLDVAGGTGDIAFRILDRIGTSFPGQSAEVTVVDVNAEMLAKGRERAARRGHDGAIAWIEGDAEDLPIPDASVDVYTIAFGIRNVTHIDAALAEAARVLAPGGRFFALEFSRLAIPGLDRLYDAYSFEVIPRLGRLIAGDGEAYRYLVESIRRFPDQEAFAALMRAAGLKRVSWRNLAGGIVALHSAWKL